MMLYSPTSRVILALSWLAVHTLLLPSTSVAQTEEPITKIAPFGEFHHAGVPTTQQQENEIYIPAGDVHITDPKASPAGIAWLRWGNHSDAPTQLREQPYLAFKVKDLDTVIWKHHVLVEPVQVLDDMRIAFILVQDIVIGLVEDDSVTPTRHFGAFHHVGVPTTKKSEQEQYVAVGNVYVTDPMRSPARIAMLRWASYSSAPEKLRNQPYIAFQVKELDKTLIDKTIMVEPINTPQGWRIAFIDYKGISVGLIQE